MAKTLDEAGVKRLIQEIKGANKNLNTPIHISTEITPESMAQNVKNIADYVEKAKAAGIANVNGMAVTCLIDNDYSGVGYLYGDTTICGIKTNDALEAPSFFDVDPDGSYHENEVLVKGLSDQITSDLLVEGARRPIILTPSTTEVDEETYHKLLSDDVDVVFMTSTGDANLCTLTYKVDNGDYLALYFTCLSMESSAIYDSFLYAYEVDITNTSPYTCRIIENVNNSLDSFLDIAGYLNKSILTPVLQEIDLTGTDAERKAKLAKFETDWKALTGASDLTGARFVGITDNEYIGVFTWSQPEEAFLAVTTHQTSPATIYLEPYSGQLTEVPLFSHLEAITIKTGNTPNEKAANVAAIKAYVDNLKALGVDTTKGYGIPCKYSDNGYIGICFPPERNSFRMCGIKPVDTTMGVFVVIESDGTYKTDQIITLNKKLSSLTTTSKFLVPAINEVNALAKGYSTIFAPIELTTDPAQNKTAIDARVAAFTAQGISLTNGCCIPVTYKGVYAGNISLINGDWYGLLVKNTNNPADNINIKLSADGTITEGNSAQ